MKNAIKNRDLVKDEVFNSYDNFEDLLNTIDDDGLMSLMPDGDSTIFDSTHITRLGVMAELKNRDGKNFKVIICPDSMTKVKLQKTIIEMGLNLLDNPS